MKEIISIIIWILLIYLGFFVIDAKVVGYVISNVPQTEWFSFIKIVVWVIVVRLTAWIIFFISSILSAFFYSIIE